MNSTNLKLDVVILWVLEVVICLSVAFSVLVDAIKVVEIIFEVVDVVVLKVVEVLVVKVG